MSLSAILLDEAYYTLLKQGVIEVDDVSVLGLEYLILFKAGHQAALAKTVDHVYGTSFHLTDRDVLLDDSRDILNSEMLEEIILSETCIEIGEHAFEGCSNLKSIYLPKAIGNVGEDAFKGCTNLTIKCTPRSYDEMYADAKHINLDDMNNK